MNWTERLFGTKSKSGSIAKERLQMVLIHDRSNVSPGLLAEIKDEIIAVIAKHLTIDPEAVEVNLTQAERESRLVAEIPLLANGRKQKAN
ncbi:MAG: cell division topological specificity factor MinE [Chloroflexota bacterium]